MSEMIRIEGAGRIDIGVADHELLEDVVLDGPGELLRRHALFFRRDDVKRQHRQHRAVHRHRHGHFRQGNAVEQRAHVIDGIDRDTRHADITLHPRMVAVIAAMGGEVEGDGKALLPGRQIAPVKGVGILGRGEAGILADRPGLLHVHRRIGAAQERRQAGHPVEEIEALECAGVIDRRQRNALRRRQRFRADRAGRAGSGKRPFHLREIGQAAHDGYRSIMIWEGWPGRGLPHRRSPPVSACPSSFTRIM